MLSLREILERFRGEPIIVAPPVSEIPCNETSDDKLLCKSPVVSVVMATYNHEKYIGQAIESVLGQITNFEYEILIGEDASTDRTRSICFSYQERFPEKIRVIWSEKNINEYGGNHIRIISRCRGEYIAFCEGDDYWCDVNKLQKQVDIMRSNANVSLCCGNALVVGCESKYSLQSVDECRYEISPGSKVVASLMSPQKGKNIITCTTLFRSEFYRYLEQQYEIFSWHLMLGDKQIWIALGLMGDVCFFNDNLSAYRVHPLGVSHARGTSVSRDGGVVSLYFSYAAPQVLMGLAPAAVMQILSARLTEISRKNRWRNRVRAIRNILSDEQIADALYLNFGLLGCWCSLMGKLPFAFYKRLVWLFRKRFLRCFPR